MPVQGVAAEPAPQGAWEPQEAGAAAPEEAEGVWFEIYRVLVDDFPLPLREGEPVAPPLGRRNLQFRFGVDGEAPTDSVAYRFRMEGLDGGWVDAMGRPFARYAAIPPGSYTFVAEARDAGGRWRRTDALAVEVAPYFYETVWFSLLLVGAAALLIGALFWFQTRQVRAQADRLAMLVEARTRELQEENDRTEAAAEAARASRAEAEGSRAEAEAARAEAEAARAHAEEMLATTEAQALQLLRVDHLKSRLFANLSHEFRTPLTLILDPLERAVRGELGELDGYATHVLDLARLNAIRLLRLINQLLDLSKLEGGGMELRTRERDLVAFLQEAVDLFGSEAERLGVRLLFRAEAPRLPVHFDAEKLEKVVFNLLANALKADAGGGKVLVSVRAVPPGEAAGQASAEDAPDGDEADAWRAARLAASGYAEIAVRDTGIGIEPEKLPFIFDRFYQTEAGPAGTGIGLSLVKELVELHRGDVSVESEPGFGSTFTVRLPLGTAHLAAHERVGDDGPAHEPFASRDLTPEAPLLATQSLPAAPAEPEGEAAPAAPDGGARPLVLVVDDHAELRALIRTGLEPHYRVAEAANGVQGLRCVRDLRPDLVVTDVVMPGGDGLELCRALREDEDLASTPVIVLTARADHESRIDGYDVGADDYLTKPFRGEELRARVANLLRRRRTMRERFSRELVLEPLARPVQAADAAFVEDVFAVIERHLADPDLTVAQLADELGVSQSQLKRKLRAVADQSPVEVVRCYRLARAAKLLAGRAGTVSEVAYAVGFNSASYFSKVFREHTGQLPSEVLAAAEAADAAAEEAG